MNQVRIGWWMQVHTKYVEWPLCITIFPLCDESIEGGALQAT